MGNFASKALISGLAGVLSGQLKKNAAEIQKQKDALEKKKTELEMKRLFVQTKGEELKNNIERMRQKEEERKQGIAGRLATEGIESPQNQPTFQTAPQAGSFQSNPSGQSFNNLNPQQQQQFGQAVQNPKRPVSLGEQLSVIQPDKRAQFLEQWINANRGGSAKDLSQASKFDAQAEQARETANLLRGATGGTSGASGGPGERPVLTQIGPSGPTFAMPQAQADLEALKAGARERAKPLPTAVQDKVSALMDVQDKMNFVTQNFQPSMTGKGFQGSTGGVTSGLRRFTGDMPDVEVKVRQALGGARDDLLRAKSGAQINEQEYARLSKLLPNMDVFGDEPTVFKAMLEGFSRQLAKTIQRKTSLATTPRSQLSVGGQSSKGNLSNMSDEQLLEALNK